MRGKNGAAARAAAQQAASRKRCDRTLHGERQAAIAARARKRSGTCCSTRRRSPRSFPARTACRKSSDTHFRADVTLGVGPVKGRYRAEIALSDLDPPQRRDAERARRRARSAAAAGRASHHARSRRRRWHTTSHYDYDAGIGGKVASRRRTPARRRGAGHHRPVLRRAGAPAGGDDARRRFCRASARTVRRRA